MLFGSTESGEPLELDTFVIDMRRLKAGDYELRVHRPEGASAGDPETFSIQVRPPDAGAFHPASDRDVVRGGDGEDIIIGNGDLDRLFGDSGNDQFIGEEIEVCDLAGESRFAPDASEVSKIQPASIDLSLEDRKSVV